MKIKSILATMLLPLVFVTCKKDSDDPEVTSVVGTWKIHSVKLVGTANSNGQSVPINQEQVVADACMARTNFVFNEDKSGKSESYVLQSGNCTLADARTFTYEYNTGAKQLKIVNDGKTETSSITQLTQSKMTVVERVDSQNLGEVEPSMEGIYFSGTIATTLKK